MKKYSTITTLIITALFLTSTTAYAQHGSAELWIWDDVTDLPEGPTADDNGIRELDETGPTAGAFVSTESIQKAPEIEFAGGVFYNSANNSTLEIVNASTGLVDSTLTLDFSGTITGAPDDAPVATALEVIGSTLYAGIVGGQPGEDGSANASELATINTTTGVVTSIGLTGLDRPLGGLAYNGTMYAVNAGGANPASLYTIDLGTGTATLVGSTGVQLTGLEFGADGVLYALGRGNEHKDDLFTLDPVTGSSTPLGVITGGPNGGSITSSYIIPEPATLGLLAAGLACTLRRRSAR